jgi:hypothetical protein
MDEKEANDMLVDLCQAPDEAIAMILKRVPAKDLVTACTWVGLLHIFVYKNQFRFPSNGTESSRRSSFGRRSWRRWTAIDCPGEDW